MSDLPQVAKEKAEKEAEEAEANPSAEVLFIRASGRFVHPWFTVMPALLPALRSTWLSACQDRRSLPRRSCL